MRYIKTITPFYSDSRGTMAHLLDGKIKIIGAIIITCKKGAVRANHYHKKDTHYCYIMKGSMLYTYRELNKKNTLVKTVRVKEGQLIMTPPMVAHAMQFPEDSVFLTLTTEPRKQKSYEKDTVRIKLV